MPQPRLLGIAGSTREGSYNRSLLAAAAAAAEERGAEVEIADLAELPLPLFNADLESAEGIPANALSLKRRLREADGLLVASPEYNSAFSPLLKNAIDWCSRAESEDEPPLSAYRGKCALLMSASPGPLGGLRGLHALRAVFQNIGVTVHPDLLTVRAAHEVFDENGGVADEKWRKKIEAAAAAFTDFAAKLTA